MHLTNVAMNPWDFTLYTRKTARIMTVIFSEGDCKAGIERFFFVAEAEGAFDDSPDRLKRQANEIRAKYPDIALQKSIKRT